MNNRYYQQALRKHQEYLDGSFGARDIAVRNMTIDQAIAVERKNTAYCLRQLGAVR
jgi:hypothetical protein